MLSGSCTLSHFLVGEEQLAARAAQHIASLLQDALELRGRAFLALSCREELLPLYSRVARDARLPSWANITVCALESQVSPGGHRNSAESRLRDALSGALVPESNWVMPDQELRGEECAAEYAERLENLLLRPDVCVLGDGHLQQLPIAAEAHDEDLLTLSTPEGVCVSISFLGHARALVFAVPHSKDPLWNEALRNDQGLPFVDRLRERGGELLALMSKGDTVAVFTTK